MNLWDSYFYIFDTYGDPRVKDWFLMSSPFPTIAISLIYAMSVKKIGPKLMEHKRPFQLQKSIITYNFVQVLLSAYLFYESCVNGWATFYSYTCQPVDFSNNPIALRTLRGCYIYFLSKFFEFIDTVFFVLKKNNHQISTLHVIHHGIMPMSVWWGVKFLPGGNSTFFGFLNSFVHIIMYSYYLVAALGPQYKKYLWWKKYLTLLQMVQFALVGIHAAQLLFIECDYPKTFVYMIFGHAVMFMYLFYKFYDRSYHSGKWQSVVIHVKDKYKWSGGGAIQNMKEKSWCADAKKLNIAILYESLCPDSIRFINNQLTPNYNEISEYVNITFVPFGKAYSDQNQQFECQHGPTECQGNRIQSCVLKVLSNQHQQVTYVDCFMKRFYFNPVELGQKCATQGGAAWESVKQCVESKTGTQLQLNAETITSRYSPKFIPTIIYDEVFDQNAQDSSIFGFRKYVCGVLQETNPEACASDLSLKPIQV